MLLYFAAPLFTQAERLWNRELVAALRAFNYQVFFPQEEAAPILEHGMDPGRIFQTMIDGVKTADAVVAILDGPDPDSGTSWECGYAYALGKPVYIVRTDIRNSGDDTEFGVNLMPSRSASGSVRHEKDSPSSVAKSIAKVIQGSDYQE